jgi:hypothetical protein
VRFSYRKGRFGSAGSVDAFETSPHATLDFLLRHGVLQRPQIIRNWLCARVKLVLATGRARRSQDFRLFPARLKVLFYREVGFASVDSMELPD